MSVTSARPPFVGGLFDFDILCDARFFNGEDGKGDDARIRTGARDSVSCISLLRQ